MCSADVTPFRCFIQGVQVQVLCLLQTDQLGMLDFYIFFPALECAASKSEDFGKSAEVPWKKLTFSGLIRVSEGLAVCLCLADQGDTDHRLHIYPNSPLFLQHSHQCREVVKKATNSSDPSQRGRSHAWGHTVAVRAESHRWNRELWKSEVKNWWTWMLCERKNWDEQGYLWLIVTCV